MLPRVLDELEAGSIRRPSVPAPHTVQDADAKPGRIGVRADLDAVLQEEPGGMRAEYAGAFPAAALPDDEQADETLPSTRHHHARDRLYSVREAAVRADRGSARARVPQLLCGCDAGDGVSQREYRKNDHLRSSLQPYRRSDLSLEQNLAEWS